MGRVSDRLDGIAFDYHKGRFTGTVELEEEEAAAAEWGAYLVTVTVCKVSDINAKIDKKSGETTRIPVLSVVDARVLDDELKTLLVERLGLMGPDTTDGPIRIIPGERTEAQREASVNVETGEMQFNFPDQDGDLEEVDFEDYEDDTEIIPIPALAAQAAATAPQAQAPAGAFERFTETEGPQVIGRITSKDATLQSALASDAGWQ